MAHRPQPTHRGGSVPTKAVVSTLVGAAIVATMTRPVMRCLASLAALVLLLAGSAAALCGDCVSCGSRCGVQSPPCHQPEAQVSSPSCCDRVTGEDPGRSPASPSTRSLVAWPAPAGGLPVKLHALPPTAPPAQVPLVPRTVDRCTLFSLLLI